MARLRGVADASASATLKLRELGLEEKAEALASTLSGGQKRKLNVAMALIGGCTLLLLFVFSTSVSILSACSLPIMTGLIGAGADLARNLLVHT